MQRSAYCLKKYCKYITCYLTVTTSQNILLNCLLRFDMTWNCNHFFGWRVAENFDIQIYLNIMCKENFQKSRELLQFSKDKFFFTQPSHSPTQLISLQTFLVNGVPIHTKMPHCLIIVKNSIEGLLWTSPNLQKSERNSYNKKSLVEKAKLTERLAGPKLASGIGTVLILNVFNKHSNVLISKGEPEANILRSLGNELFLNL